MLLAILSTAMKCVMKRREQHLLPVQYACTTLFTCLFPSSVCTCIKCMLCFVVLLCVCGLPLAVGLCVANGVAGTLRTQFEPVGSPPCWRLVCMGMCPRCNKAHCLRSVGCTEAQVLLLRNLFISGESLDWGIASPCL